MRYFNDELSNISYTNKDFSTIYPELLDFADSVSDKWKPSLSNESDPGVVLLKLAALMADKNNYNIDKNILELFPMSVTQYANAREIYEQCGYSMHYYQAAEVVVSMTPDNIKVKTDAEEESYLMAGSEIQLPMFTTLSGADKKIVYTLICDLNDTPWESSNIYPEDVTLHYGLTTDFVALQGKPVKYMINGNDYITYENLDYNNRLYFNERQIAENGIFITNVDVDGGNTNNFNKWVRVDNLWTQPPESYCYKLGISRDTGRVYLEFPSDIAAIIKNGLRIYYIVTDGSKGSVQPQYLDSFLDDRCVPSRVVDKDKDISEDFQDGLTKENIHIINNLVSSVGKDPETLDEAYKSYERYKNTFDTLVSINDYNNYLRRNYKDLSNGFICDRTNDIQHAYKIKSFYDGKSNDDLIKEIDVAEKKEYLNAFNLRIYGLQGSPSINNGSEEAFKLSFTPVTDNVNIGALRNFIDDMAESTQAVCHDFIPLTEGRLAFVFLEFLLDAKIIPYTKLDTLQQVDVYGKVYSALLKLLNATNIEFGQAIDYDTVYDTIKGADNRIQSLILDDITYTPHYYVKKSNAEIKKLDSSKNEDKALITTIENEIAAKCVLAGVTPLYIFDNSFSYEFESTDTEMYENITSISSKWTPTLESEAEYTLTSNENIYLKAPNYVTKEQYGGFVKCFMKFQGLESVRKNTTKQLVGTGNPPDYIAFFWKTDDDSNYQYAIYSGDSIFVQPQYTIKALDANGENVTKKSQHEVYDTAVRRFIQSKITNSSGIVTGTLSPDETVVVNPNIVNIEESVSTIQDLTLSAKQTISIVSPNTIKMSKVSKIYFRRNTIIEDASGKYYTLSSGDVLGTGEYIYYTTNPRSSLIELGAGTEIMLPKGSSPLKAKALTTSEEIVEFSLAPLKYLQDKNLWLDVNEGELIENKFYNLGPGSSIKVDKKIPLGSSWTSLANCVIEYKPETNDTEWITIPSIVITSSDGDGGWMGKSFLSITGSAASPQKLKKDQAITIQNKDHTITIKNEESDTINNEESEEEKTIQFSPELNLLGDSDSYTLLSPVSAISYTVSSNTEERAAAITLTSAQILGASGSVTFTVLAGNYLLPFELIGPNVGFDTYNNSLSVSVKIDEQEPKYYSQVYHTGKNYVEFTCVKTSNVTVAFSPTKNVENKQIPPDTIRIYRPLKYTVNDKLPEGAKKALPTYDPMCQYEKDYIIPEGDIIMNPLAAQSFLDADHPYNKCCICKWVLPAEEDNQIRITNKIK